MDDLAKSITVNSAPLKQRKQSEWLTKDRFWNFVFWFGMSSGLALGDVFRFNFKILQIASFVNWTTLILIPLLLLIFNRTRFIKKDTFTNSQGNLLTKKQLPYMFPLAIMSGFGFAFIVAETILPKGVENIIISFIFFSCLFSGLSLYFIFKNCPISLLFNYKFWNFKLYLGRRVNSTSNHFSSSSSSSNRSSSSDYYTNPVYSSSPSNIHYESHRRR